MAAHRSAESIAVTPRLKSNGVATNAEMMVRAGGVGGLQVYAFNSTDKKQVSTVHCIKVVTCDSFLAVGEGPDFKPRSKGFIVGAPENPPSTGPVPPPQPLFRLAGVASISGVHSIEVPTSVAPTMADGDWSLSFWVYLIDPPGQRSGSKPFRSLFFKGDSTVSTGRTPSVWLLPDRNRMTIRVSTETDPDLGVESFIDIPNFKWTLLSFAFTNETKRSRYSDSVKKCREVDSVRSDISDAASKGVLMSTELDHFFMDSGQVSHECDVDPVVDPSIWYKIEAYCDEKLDVSASFQTKVLGNDEPLRLFSDPSHSGPRGFAADITVWDGALTVDHVSSLVRAGGPSGTRGIERAIHLLNSTSAASTGEARALQDYDNYPSVLNRLLYPHDGAVNTATLRRKTPLDFIDQDKNADAPTDAPLKAKCMESHSVRGCIEKDCRGCAAEDCASECIVRSAGVHLTDVPVPTGSAETDLDPVLANVLHAEAAAAYNSCEDTDIRLNMYAQAAASAEGHKTYGENLFKWGMLKSFGVEAPDTKCGVASTGNHLDGVWGSLEDTPSDSIKDQVQTFRAMVRAMAVGHSAALPVIATLLNSGSSAVTTFIEIFDNLSEEARATTPLEVEIAGQIGEILLNCERARSERVAQSRQSEKEPENVLTSDRAIRPGDSAFCFQDSSSTGFSRSIKQAPVADPLLELSIGLLHVAAVTGVADGHISAPEVYMALSHRYQHGVGVPKDVETAGFYASISADASSTAFHAVGGMPVAETERIDENTEKTIELGNMGDDDEAIQLLRVRAEEGDVPAMVNMGDLHYFGARGLPRDQAQALDFYNRAAAARNPQGICCAAAMYLKGEGMEASNGTKAVEMYTEAAEMGSVKALNGLGYIYFHGTGGVETNQTKAFECFLNATLKDEDADSWYNAGFCLQNGLGVVIDLERAASFYKKAITKYGHFGSAFLLGNMYYHGHGVQRSVEDALYYLNSINALGPWAGWVRRGLDAYLEKNVKHASLCYLHAGELGGFEVAHSNAAFLLRRSTRVSQPTFIESVVLGADEIFRNRMGFLGFFNMSSTEVNHTALSDRQSAQSSASVPVESNRSGYASSNLYHPSALLRQALLAAKYGNTDAMRFIGDIFYNGMYLPFDDKPGSNRSVMWYSRASARGSAMSSFTLGFMHQFGIGTATKDVSRAEKYYSDALQRSGNDNINSVPMQLLGKGMLWWLRRCKEHSWMASANGLLEDIVARFDFF